MAAGSPVLDACQLVQLGWAVGLEGLLAACLPEAIHLAAGGPLTADAGCLADFVQLQVAEHPEKEVFWQHLLYQGQLHKQCSSVSPQYTHLSTTTQDQQH